MFSALALIVATSTRCDIRPQVQFAATVSLVQVTRRGPSFDAGALVTVTPRTIGRAAVSSDPGMRAHVAGYYAIARKLAQRSNVHGIGATQAQARARLTRAAVTLAHDANLEYRRQIVIYEAVTDGGRAQSQGPASGFPGGPNANVYCSK